jgi:hypothetical protein
MAFDLVRYSQQDPQWKNSKLGPGPDTIGYIGCALTSLAMYASSWGYTETPASLNQKLYANGGITSDELLVWGGISKLYPQIQNTGLSLSGGSAVIAQINASLAAGQPVIVEVDYSPDAGLQTHWVLVYAQQGDNDYLIQDPWPYPPETNQVTLMSRFSQGQPLANAIKAVAWYKCSLGAPVPAPTPSDPNPPAPTPSTPLPPAVQTDLYVQVVALATAGLRLHTQPSADSPANVAEMPGTQLNVIEDKTGALAKIGVTGQWLYVSDPSGNQGYVAAWYVQQVQGSTPPPTSTPAPNPAPTPSTPPTPPPASQPQRFVLKVIDSVGTGGLRLRAYPSLGGALVGIEQAGTLLTVLEPSDSALAKVGIANQWINVRDANGLRGYVMATYVAVS